MKAYPTNLKDYIEKENSWNRIWNPNAKPLTLDTFEDRQKIASNISSGLSPENLHCDGEASKEHVHAQYKSLTAVARELEILDPSVTIYY